MASLSSVLAQIRQNESGSASGNYGLTPQQNYAYPASHASGAYQFQPGTWQSLTQQSGIGTQYSEAYQAPPATQDAVAAYALEQNGGNANASNLWKNNNYTYPQVTNFDTSSAQLASGTSLASNQPSTTNTGFGSNGGGTSTTGDPAYYTYDPGSFVYGGGDQTASTTTPGQTGGQQTGNATTLSSSSAAGALAGQPGLLLDQPFTLGLTTGLASAINSWITGAETAVGTAFKNFASAALGEVAGWLVRFGLIILGILLILVALWRIMDPSGEKTQSFVRGAAVAA